MLSDRRTRENRTSGGMGREWGTDHERASEALQWGNPQQTDRCPLSSQTHSLTLAFSGHATVRSVVVGGSPCGELDPKQLGLPLFSPTCSDPHKPKKKQTSSRTPWAKMLARVFGADVETCPACGGPMKIVRFYTSAESLDPALGTRTRSPPVHTTMSATSGQLSLQWA